MPADDEALIPIENPTGILRFVARSYRGWRQPPQRCLQQQWRIVEFTTTSNGIERFEWRDVPLVEESAVIHGFEKETKQWCPGCSAYVDYACAKTHCAIGPNGLQARIDRADASLAKQLQQSMERNADLSKKMQDMGRALEWIANSPSAHPANMVRVALEGLGRES